MSKRTVSIINGDNGVINRVIKYKYFRMRQRKFDLPCDIRSNSINYNNYWWRECRRKRNFHYIEFDDLDIVKIEDDFIVHFMRDGDIEYWKIGVGIVQRN